MKVAYRVMDLDQEGPISVIVTESSDMYVQGSPIEVASVLFDSPGFLALEPVQAAKDRNPKALVDLSFLPAHHVVAVRVVAEADYERTYKDDALY